MAKGVFFLALLGTLVLTCLWQADQSLLAAATHATRAQAETGAELLLVVEPDRGAIQVIDPGGPRLMRSLATEAYGVIGVASDRRVYFLNVHNTLFVLDLTTGSQTALATTSDVLRTKSCWSLALAITPGSERLVLAHHGGIGPGDVAEVGTFWRSVLDAKTGAQLSRIPPEPEQIKTSSAAACMLPQMIIAPDGRRLYDLCLWGGSYPLEPERMIRVVDLVEGRVTGTLKLPGAFLGALAPDGEALYVLDRGGRLSVVATDKLVVTAVKAVRGSGGPTSLGYGARLLIAPDGSQLFLSDGEKGNTIYQITVGTWETAARFVSAESIEDIGISPDGRRLYALTASRLSILDAGDLREQAALPLAGREVRGQRMILVVPPAK